MLADSTAFINTLSIGGALSGAQGSGGTTGALAGAGAAGINTIQTTVEAAIRDNLHPSGNRGVVGSDLTIKATDSSTITADVVGASLAFSSGSGGANGAVAIGVSIARNEIDNRVHAYMDDASANIDRNVAAGDGVDITVTEEATITALSVAASASIAAGSSNSLAVSGTQVTGAGLVHVKDLKNLRVLNVSKCAVTDEGLTHLEKMTTLGVLALNGTKVTSAGLVHLKTLPDLRGPEPDRLRRR